MLRVNSSTAVAETVPATSPIAGPEQRLAIPIGPTSGRARARANPPPAAAALKDSLRRGAAVLVGVGELLIIGWTFPLVILAVGIPIALLVRLVMRLVGAL